MSISGINPSNWKPAIADTAVVLLAERLYESMERLDPGDGRSWDELSPREREFYRVLMTLVLEERELVAQAIADNDNVGRGSEESKKSQADAK